MRITPRSLVLASAVLAAAAFTTHTAAAETVKVPFSFKVNGKTLPAGRYTVQTNHLSNFVTMKGPAADENFTWVLRPGDPDPASDAVTMSFVQHGTGYELRGIKYRALSTPKLDTNTSKADAERTLRGE